MQRVASGDLQALRHASRTRVGRFTATLLYVFGYATVIALWREAVHEIFAPAGSREFPGWWFIPAVIVAGWAVKYAVDRFAKWWLRRYRHANESSVP
jgi:hypothetical protein